MFFAESLAKTTPPKMPPQVMVNWWLAPRCQDFLSLTFAPIVCTSLFAGNICIRSPVVHLLCHKIYSAVHAALQYREYIRVFGVKTSLWHLPYSTWTVSPKRDRSSRHALAMTTVCEQLWDLLAVRMLAVYGVDADLAAQPRGAVLRNLFLWTVHEQRHTDRTCPGRAIHWRQLYVAWVGVELRASVFAFVQIWPMHLFQGTKGAKKMYTLLFCSIHNHLHCRCRRHRWNALSSYHRKREFCFDPSTCFTE